MDYPCINHSFAQCTTQLEEYGVIRYVDELSTYRQTAPHLYVDRGPVGGFVSFRAFERSGVLKHLVRSEL
jgi:hypothetical protein